MESNKKTSRRKFLQLCGTVVAGGTIVGLSSVLLQRNLASEKVTWQGGECPFPNASCSACNLRQNCLVVNRERSVQRGECPFPGIPCSACELRNNCPARPAPPMEETPKEETLKEEIIFERGVCPFPGIPCSTCELIDNCPVRM